MNGAYAPLAERMRPKVLADFIGQSAITGPGSVIRSAVETGNIPSIIFWGPPGVGKTTLALIIAAASKRQFYSLSAVHAGVKEVREVIATARRSELFTTGKPILFIDEIHRFSKSQQDSLLEAVEKGWIVLIGATTENPSFEVISALLSRCQIFVLESLGAEDLRSLLVKALESDEVLKERQIEIVEDTALLRLSGGDGRKLLNILELLVTSEGQKVVVTDSFVTAKVQAGPALYDKTGEQHYDIISAFIKSMRGSDPNGALYWLARMLKGGEDPLFIARRMLILASEDIGNANINALQVASSCFKALEVIGMPEGRIILAQAVTYLAASPKSNSAYEGISAAQKLVDETGDLPVPLYLRNAPTTLMRDLGYGTNYAYSHSFSGNFKDQEYLPPALGGTLLYDPGANKSENAIRERLKELWKGKYGY